MWTCIVAVPSNKYGLFGCLCELLPQLIKLDEKLNRIFKYAFPDEERAALSCYIDFNMFCRLYTYFIYVYDNIQVARVLSPR